MNTIKKILQAIAAVIMFAIMALIFYTCAYAETAVTIRDRAGNKAEVKKIGTESGLLNFSGDSALQVRIEFGTAGDEDGNPKYVGWADPAAADGETSWRIVKITWDGDGPTGIYFGNQVDTFTLEWDERASYDFTP